MYFRRPRFFANSHDHLYNVPLEKQYNDYQPIPNGNNPETVSNVDVELDLRKPSILRPPRMSKRPSWSSDSSLTKRKLARVVSMGRDRADTDCKERKPRKRKISFPLHLVKFFGRNDSRKISSESNCTVKSSVGSVSRKLSSGNGSFSGGLEKEFEYAQEYVPLRHANADCNDSTSSKQFLKGKEKKRKISIPPLVELSAENNATVPTLTVNEKVSR